MRTKILTAPYFYPLLHNILIMSLLRKYLAILKKIIAIFFVFSSMYRDSRKRTVCRSPPPAASVCPPLTTASTCRDRLTAPVDPSALRGAHPPTAPCDRERRRIAACTAGVAQKVSFRSQFVSYLCMFVSTDFLYVIYRVSQKEVGVKNCEGSSGKKFLS